ncbi:MAG: CoA transferase [Desulfohalobiaceae bacterium]|nr:CoA transferase [Desulfohalobiaceae bacterium]
MDLNAFFENQLKSQEDQDLPLSGVRIIDMASLIAAPFAATLLADYGAQVIKVENPMVPDGIRNWAAGPDMPVQPFWAVFARNKFPMTLNLKTREGKEIFFELVNKADVLTQNMRPGALDKLGIGKDMLLEANPGLIIGSVSGYGQSGPYASRPGFGTLAEAYSGFVYLNAHPGGPPTNPPLALADLIAGTNLALAIMIALRKQKRGQYGGQEIDISLYEPLFGMLGPDFLSYSLTGTIPQPKGNELSYVAPRNSYQTKEGRWVSLSGSAQKACERIFEAAGHPEMNEDPRFSTNEERIKDENRKIVNQVIADWIGSMTLDEVIKQCDSLGVTIGTINTMADIAEDPHYQARESFIAIEDPVSGKTLKIPNVPFRLLQSPGHIQFPGMPVGSANDVVLTHLLGRQEEEVAALKAGKAL